MELSKLKRRIEIGEQIAHAERKMGESQGDFDVLKELGYAFSYEDHIVNDIKEYYQDIIDNLKTEREGLE